MANQFVNLPVPAGNGVGAAVDVSTFGASKSIVVGGNAQASITVEINNDAGQLGSWSALKTFQNAGELVIDVACRWMRVRVSNYNSYVGGAPNVDVGGSDDGTSFANLVAPVGNGNGAPVDVTALGIFKTVQVGGAFRGMVIVEVSEDGNDWAQPFAFQSQSPGYKTLVITAEFMRVKRVGVPKVDPGLPIVNVGACEDGGGGGGAAVASNCFIYKPGSGETGPVVFDDWGELYTALEDTRADANDSGCYTIMFDDSDVSPAVVPAGAYDMTNVTWEGTGEYRACTVVHLNALVVLTGLRKITNYLMLVNVGATTPISDMALTQDDYFLVGVGCELHATGPEGDNPLIDVTSNAFDVAVFLDDYAVLENVGSPVVHFSAGAGLLTIAMIGAGSEVNSSSLSGTAGGTIALTVKSSAIERASVIQAGVLGTLTFVNDTQVRFDPVGPYTEDEEADYNEVVEVDPSAAIAPLVMTLPEQNVEEAGNAAKGRTIIVKNVTSSTNPIAVTPAGADTIDGVAGAVTMTKPFGSIMLVADGAGNWDVVKEVSGAAYCPPEQWAQNGVIAISQVEEPLDTQVSTSFDDWQAIRDGAVVGISVRFSATIVDGTATFDITVNGVVVAGLQFVSTDLSNPDGGVAVASPGVPYSAGDKIGVVISTDADFDPILNDVEVSLQIQDR